MSDPSRSVPTYRRHKSSGRAVVTLPDGSGGRRDVQLGKFGTKASRVEYARVIAEWEARGRALPPPAVCPSLSMAELLAAFWRHAEDYYRGPDGEPAHELGDYKLSLRPLRELYGNSPAAAFGPLALKTVRQAMIDAGLCRNVINARVGRIKRVFKWAVAEELIPPTVLHGLQAVTGLTRGRTEARESPPVKPVHPRYVEAVLPFVLPPVAAMIRLQQLTGCRPGEAVQMRAVDIERTGKAWLYKPPRHKNAWRGMARTVMLGPQAQAIVREFLTTDLHAPLFSPARALADRAVLKRAARKTPVQPSQVYRRKRNPRRSPGDKYTRDSYTRAIATGCDKADRHARQQAENERAAAEGRQAVNVPKSVPEGERLIPRWFPLQLRHLHATEIRKAFGLEGAQVALGHARCDVTQVYSERDAALAEKIALEVG